MVKSTILGLLFAAFICGALVSAQALSSLGDSAGKKNQRRAWIVHTGFPDSIDNPVQLLLGDEVMKLTLPNSVASRPFPVPTDGLVRLIKSSQNKESGELEIQTLAKAVVPEECQQAMVLLVYVPNAPESGTVFKTKVIDLLSFKPGGHLYLNLTDAVVGVEINDKKFLLKSGDMRIEELTSELQPTAVPYRFSCQDLKRNKWRVVSASMTYATAAQRDIKIFYRQMSNGSIRCKGVTFPIEP